MRVFEQRRSNSHKTIFSPVFCHQIYIRSQQIVVNGEDNIFFVSCEQRRLQSKMPNLYLQKMNSPSNRRSHRIRCISIRKVSNGKITL
jgi:hypothetical protein